MKAVRDLMMFFNDNCESLFQFTTITKRCRVAIDERALAKFESTRTLILFAKLTARPIGDTAL